MNNRIRSYLGRWSRLFIAVLCTATIVPQLLGVTPAAADDGGYPWVSAVATGSQYSWGYSTCPSSDPNCMKMTDHNYGTADPWIYNLRNCTSYAAWKINQVFNVSNITGWGNAATWNTGYANPQPYPVYSPSIYTPQVGDIAQWGAEVAGGAGHVAYVYAVNNGVASLAEYNSGLPKDANGNLQWGLFYNGRTTAASSAGTPDHYIHIGSVSTLPTFRIGALDANGNLMVKENDLNAQWTLERSSTTQGTLSGGMIGALTSDGTFYVKRGALNAQWVTEYAGASGGVVSDSGSPTIPWRIGVLAGGHFYVKENDLNAQWTDMWSAGGVVAGYLDGTRVGVVTSDGTLSVKDGALNAPWTTEDTGITRAAFSNQLIGEVTTGDTFNVKQGGLSAQWTPEYAGAWAGMVSDATPSTPLRIAILTDDATGTLKVKEGNLSAQWITEQLGASQGAISGNLIGALVNGTWLVKQGATNAQWTTQFTGATAGMVWSAN